MEEKGSHIELQRVREFYKKTKPEYIAAEGEKVRKILA